MGFSHDRETGSPFVPWGGGLTQGRVIQVDADAYLAGPEGGLHLPSLQVLPGSDPEMVRGILSPRPISKGKGGKEERILRSLQRAFSGTSADSDG